jgi:CRP-like cAMP-binding protein
MQRDRTEALQGMPIFGGLRRDTLAALLDTAASRTQLAGECFFREGDRAESLFVLESGEVEVFRLYDGREHLLARLGAGDCFGEMALLDLLPRSATVRALTPCTAIELSTASLFRLYETDLEQFALVQMNVARELSRRLREADERLLQATRGRPQTVAEGWGRLYFAT